MDFLSQPSVFPRRQLVKASAQVRAALRQLYKTGDPASLAAVLLNKQPVEETVEVEVEEQDTVDLNMKPMEEMIEVDIDTNIFEAFGKECGQFGGLQEETLPIVEENFHIPDNLESLPVFKDPASFLEYSLQEPTVLEYSDIYTPVGDSSAYSSKDSHINYFNTVGEVDFKLESEVEDKSWHTGNLEEPSVQCDICNYKPNKASKKTIRVHKEAIHYGVKHSCPHCEKTWTTRSNLLKHVATVHSGRSLNCAECSFSSSSREQLKYHNERAHLKTQYSCKVENCGYIARAAANLNLHHLSNHEEKKFYCLICFERFAAIIFLKPHIRQNHSGLFCDTCLYQPKTEADLVDHNTAKHGGVFYPCEKCQRACRSRLHLQWHLHAAHNKRIEKRITSRQDKTKAYVELCVCDLCGYRPKVPSLFAIKIHKEAVHDGVRYNCPQCKHPCTTRSNLNRHMEKSHGKQKQHPCDSCSYAAVNEIQLKQHMDEVHLGIFLDPTDLVIHENESNKRMCKEKPHQSCNESYGTACNFVCKTKSVLAKHYKNVHENSKFFCAECNFKTNIRVEIESHIVEHMKTSKVPETQDIGDETVNAVDSLACYAADQVYWRLLSVRMYNSPPRCRVPTVERCLEDAVT